MKQLFPANFYTKFQAPNKKEFIDALNADSGEDCNYNWSALCDVKTSRLKATNYLDYLVPSFDILSERLHYNGGYHFDDPWLNSYSRGSFQEVHDHFPWDLACVFFLNDEQGFSKFYFKDRNNVNYSPGLQDNLIWYVSPVTIDTMPGDIMFFPAHMLHGVTPHKSDVVRKTFSTNINFTK